ncbi:hypothetical protein DNTS_007168 [Danionella cerebrum]|uniref:E3 ubiquitin-protein ligase CHFR n=1 Tax=Danionella cerebrum TaxID=2873325 RepID=A0A553N4P4_9TELE|nr:hypothetical protein DNTS_007168 [Danionella translucida]
MQKTEEPPPSNTEDEICEKEKIWCLQRVGRDSDWLRLSEDSEVSVGRGLNVTHQILSSVCPLMISRIHCVFKLNSDRQWTVTDNKSLNGVWVNGRRIRTGYPFLLQHGDSVQLGVPLDGNPVEFEYVLIQRSFTEVEHFMSRSLLKETPPTSTVAHKPKNQKRKFDGDESEQNPVQASKSKMYKSDYLRAQPCPPSVLQSRLELEKGALEPGSSSGSYNLETLHQYSTTLGALKENTGSTQKHSGEPDQERILRHSAESQRTPKQTLHHQPEVKEPQSQKVVLRSHLKHQQQEPLKGVEVKQESFCQEELQRVLIMTEKAQQTEEGLKKQLEEALKEQQKVKEELEHAWEGFKEVLQAKDKELEVTKEEKEKAKAQKEEVVSQMAEVLESELQCSICSELFIEAVTLNCAHSFCQYCIREWRSRKDKCPMCWQNIVLETRSLVLDSCIDRMLEQLSTETKERRLALLAQRKGQKPSIPAAVVVINDDSDSESSISSSEEDSFIHSSVLHESSWSGMSVLSDDSDEKSSWTEDTD